MNALFRYKFFFQAAKAASSRSLYLSGIVPKIFHYKLSDIGEGIAEVQVKEWHVNTGDFVSEFDDICTVQSDKAAVTITSRYNGVVKKLHYNVDDIVKVGATLADIDDGKSDENDKPKVGNDYSFDNALASTETSTDSEKKFLATPAVRRLIREHNVDLTKVVGTGRDGRILKEDVLRHVSDIDSVSKQELNCSDSMSKYNQQAIVQQQIASTSVKTDDATTIVPIRGYTRAMIKSMTEALKIPHFGYNDEFVVDRLIEVRNELNAARGDRPKISYMPLVIKATSLALKEFPSLNASIDAKMENMIYKNYHNISLAMDTPGGLAVPNIKNCEAKCAWQIAAELNRLLELGRRQAFSSNDLSDGTFSLSNIGAVGGGTYMKPLIFPPQVAIGAIGRIRDVVRVDALTGAPRTHRVLHFSWVADHRVVDGATVARFSNRLKQFIENPTLMAAELV